MAEQSSGQVDKRFMDGDSDTVIDAAKRLVWQKKRYMAIGGKMDESTSD
jgi:hypothetical protein